MRAGTRERLFWLLGLLVFAAAGWWVSANTEWVEQQSYRGAQGEAAANPAYALEQLLRRLGMRVEHREAFDPLPPEGARLLLLSNDWDLVPARAELLRQWVQRGGHLIVPNGGEARGLGDWIPLTTVEVRDLRRPPAAARPSASAASAAATDADDSDSVQLTSTPPLWDGTDLLDVCPVADPGQRLRARAGHPPGWSLTRHLGAEALRFPMGRGSVTVLNAQRQTFFNDTVLECDNPLMIAAAIQAGPGVAVSIYLNEKREALLPWLWHRGWLAIVAGLLALAGALWRASLRFGPRTAVPPRLRRSISEQVRGLGHYLHREGRDALLAAQRRALDETAARHLPSYRLLQPAQRSDAIAKATGLAPEALSTALNARDCSRAELPSRLQLLESARRLLQRSPKERRSPS